MHDGILFPFSPEKLIEYLDNSSQSQYLISYLKFLEAKTFIVEKDYVDKDFLIDYQKFYSRTFIPIERFTNRIHFFKESFTESHFLDSLDKNDIRYLQGSYLGFIVVRPIEGSDGNRLMGRTIIKTYPKKKNSEERIFIRDKYNCSLFGIPLSINSLPFQTQDRGVSACATIALWVTIQHLSNPYGIPKLSPAEITDIATIFPSEYRKFPSSGLTWEQMINCIKSFNLDVETINLEDGDELMLSTVIKSFINAGFPLIGALALHKKGEEKPRYHAAVISGYRYNKSNGVITELYVHDDTIGPYSRVKPINHFREWDNEWKNLGFEVKLEKILVPVYQKVRLTFARVYRRYKIIRERIKNKYGDDLDLELLLYTIQDYKNFLLKNKVKAKKEILTRSMPRFLWVMRAYYKDKTLLDIVHDGTSIYPKESTLIIDFM